MRRGSALLVALGVALTACDGGDAGSPAATAAEPTVSASPSVSPDVSPSADTATATPDPETTALVLPEPDERIPRGVRALAEELEATALARRIAVRDWIRSGGTAEWPPPDEVELLVLHEQRIYRLLAAYDRLAGRVLGRVPAHLKAEVRSNIAAGAALYDHFQPVDELPDFETRRPEPADTLLGYFRAAEQRFGVGWEYLAAVMLIETRMGRIASSSSAGAQGPMQFLPATWRAYGLGGDVHDPRDAILGAANYLHASGAPGDERGALYAYNPSPHYVRAIALYARRIRADHRAFYAYYAWQVRVG
jgi:Transglycosylase SLT domain